MKTVIFLILIASISQSAVLKVFANSGWENLPFCNGKTRLVCEEQSGEVKTDSCKVEISGSKCTKVNLYTNSTFYPSVWTVFETRSRNAKTQISVDADKLSGINKKYFYVFLSSDSNNPYTKIKYQLSK